MKKLLLPLAIAAALPVSALADVTVYGKANVSWESHEETSKSGGLTSVTTNEDYTRLQSNASRIGVKGSQEISEGLKAIYKFEYETYIDDGKKGDDNNDTFSQRNIYVGLEGGFGQVIAGKFDTPLKAAQNKVDLFNDLAGDIKNVVTKYDNRESNSVQYSTGKLMGPVVIAVDYINSEEDGTDDGISSSIAFDNDNIYLAAAYDMDVEKEGLDNYRLVGQFKLGPVQLGALWEEAEYDVAGSKSIDSEAWVTSIKWSLNKEWALKAQYGESENFGSKLGVDGETLSLGVDYKLAKNTKVFAFYTENDLTADKLIGSDSSEEAETFGLGLEVKF